MQKEKKCYSALWFQPTKLFKKGKRGKRTVSAVCYTKCLELMLGDTLAQHTRTTRERRQRKGNYGNNLVRWMTEALAM